MIFSLPFLFITFCVYGFIPELRNLHGKSLMCYVFSLSTLYIGLSVVQLEGELFWAESIPCIFTGYMIYISVLLCFFWLNVMCYDIWSTFKDIRGRGSERKRFMFYSMYAIGVPLFLTSIVFCIDRYSSLDDRFKPLIGITRCWIQHSRIVEAMYTYAPISVILVVNIALYSITACTISRVLQETSVIRNGESQKHSKSDADKDRYEMICLLELVCNQSPFRLDFISTFVCSSWWGQRGAWSRFLGFSRTRSSSTPATSSTASRDSSFSFSSFGSQKSGNFLSRGKKMHQHSFSSSSLSTPLVVINFHSTFLCFPQINFSRPHYTFIVAIFDHGKMNQVDRLAKHKKLEK